MEESERFGTAAVNVGESWFRTVCPKNEQIAAVVTSVSMMAT